MTPALYLIPVTLGSDNIETVLPSYNKTIIQSIKHFVVEDVRSARRFLKQVDKGIDIDALTFYPMGKHADTRLYTSYLSPLLADESIGILSEAGCPAIADPGAMMVALAQQKGLKVIPLVGPSSILLSLMSSGFNGQQFAFHGYLPIDAAQRSKAIKQLEGRAISEGQTQIFIETPYRNEKLWQELLRTLRPNTLLCVATGITLAEEYIVTKSVATWRKSTLPPFHKLPTIFLFAAP